jgi:hypothetical protein
MHMPISLPAALRGTEAVNVHNMLGTPDRLTPQGCNVFEWAGCAAAVAGCAALSGPALIACVAAAAPGCVKCVT